MRVTRACFNTTNIGVTDMMRIKDLFPDASGSGRVLVLGELLLDLVPCDSDMRLSQPGTVLKTVSGSSGIYACAAAGFGLDCSFIAPKKI